MSYTAFCTAGLTKRDLAASATGVFVGIQVGEFSALSLQREPGPYSATGGSAAIASNRISYALGLEGTSMSVDTACSSALVALEAACQSLRTGSCVAALNATVGVLLTPGGFIFTCRAHMLSEQGYCKTFDHSANGFARAEGCCAIFLQPVVQAVENQVGNSGSSPSEVLGVAINQDGRTANLTSPNGPAQQRVIQRALHRADVKACQLPLVDSHGTGTGLGDPIEISAQRAVLGHGRSETLPVITGATKSNIGHLEAAAGGLGIFKLLLALRFFEGSTPNLHFRRLNTHIALSGYNAAFPTQMLPSMTMKGLIGGTSSFGFGGTNSHLLLEASSVDSIVLRPKPITNYTRTAFAWWGSVLESQAQSAALLGALSHQENVEIWEQAWTQAICSYTAHHRVGCTPVAPGTGFLCMVREALMAAANGTGSQVLVSKAQFTAMLFLDGPAPLVRVSTEPEAEQSSGVRIESSVAAGGWVQHAMVVATIDANMFGASAQLGEVAMGCSSDEITVFVVASLFNASTGNDYLHDCKAGHGVLQHTVHRPSQVENQQLQHVSWMDANQLGVLSGPEHGGRPSVFAGAEAQGEEGQRCISNKMPEWVAQVTGGGGQGTYLRGGQLEVIRTGQHLYDTAWETLPAVQVDCDEEQGGAALVVWSCNDSTLVKEAAFGAVSIGMEQLEEVCGGLSSAGVLWCWMGGAVVQGSVLRAVQAAVSSAASVWLVSQSSTAAGCWGLAKSVNAEVGQLVGCVEVFEAQRAAVSAAQLPSEHNVHRSMETLGVLRMQMPFFASHALQTWKTEL